MVLLDEIGGVGEEEVGVGLQMDEATVDKEMAIAIEEPCGGQSLAWILHLRIAERQPYLADFALREDTLAADSEEIDFLPAQTSLTPYKRVTFPLYQRHLHPVPDVLTTLQEF